jgi:2-methylisocitrate lyase-like PEP mutase family enzyme
MSNPSPAAQMRASLAKPEIMLMPGMSSPLEARLIAQNGFACGYVSGYATAALRFGLPDIGLMALADMLDTVRAIRAVAPDLPLLVDADTGYGDVINIAHTVQSFEALGVAAVQLEDQVWPKRCGHMDGKIVEPLEVAVRKVRAAVAAKRNPETLIVARTDARQPEGLDAAIARCREFQKAGADILFVDGPESEEELRIIASAFPGVALANMSETGKTPIFSANELGAMGFKIAMFPSSSCRVTVGTVSRFYADLKASGDSRSWIPQMASLAQTNTILGMNEMRAFESDILAGKK